LCLELTESIGWKQFPQFAEQVVTLLDGTVSSKADGVELCVWRVRIQNCDLRLVYEDFPTMVSMESSSDEGDILLRKLQQTLRSKFEGAK